MLFAMGTVLGLATVSWLTYHYFRDSPFLMEVVQKQLLRNIDLDKIKFEAKSKKPGTQNGSGKQMSHSGKNLP
jgi:hypothetical protein